MKETKAVTYYYKVYYAGTAPTYPPKTSASVKVVVTIIVHGPDTRSQG